MSKTTVYGGPENPLNITTFLDSILASITTAMFWEMAAPPPISLIAFPACATG